jgi:hypothetical protein
MFVAIHLDVRFWLLRVLAVGCTLLWLLCGGARAQNGVSLTGTVQDRNFGEGIAGANVRLMSLERVLETESRVGGLFEFHKVPPGGYEMNIKGPGYIRQKQHIELQKGMNPEPVLFLCGSAMR